MLDWKTRKVWMLYLFGYCFLVGVYKLIDKGAGLDSSIAFISGSLIGTAMMIFATGALLALVAAIFTLFKKERVKAVYIVWTIGVIISSIPTLLGYPK